VCGALLEAGVLKRVTIDKLIEIGIDMERLLDMRRYRRACPQSKS
jgi:hypothetical protein